ncbi:DUF5999 family protein [Streptomyces sp. NPDC055078]
MTSSRPPRAGQPLSPPRTAVPARRALCRHQPSCRTAGAADRDAARLTTHHPEHGWSVNCTFLRSLGTAMSDCPRSSV